MEENFLYELDGKKYNLPANEVDMFLEKFPNAKKIEETDFTNPTTPGAVVEGQSEVPNVVMGSDSDPGSLDLQIDPNKFKVFDPKSINKPTGYGTKDPLIEDNIKVEENIKKAKNDDKLIKPKEIDYDDIAKKIHSNPEKYKDLLSATQNPRDLLNRNKLLEELMPGCSEVSNPYLEKILARFDKEAYVNGGAFQGKWKFNDDSNDLYTEPFSRVKMGGASMIHSATGAIGSIAGAEPYIFGEENLNEVGDGNRFVVTYDGEGESNRSTKYKTRSFNINKLRSIYNNILSNQEYKQVFWNLIKLY